MLGHDATNLTGRIRRAEGRPVLFTPGTSSRRSGPRHRARRDVERTVALNRGEEVAIDALVRAHRAGVSEPATSPSSPAAAAASAPPPPSCSPRTRPASRSTTRATPPRPRRRRECARAAAARSRCRPTLPTKATCCAMFEQVDPELGRSLPGEQRGRRRRRRASRRDERGAPHAHVRDQRARHVPVRARGGEAHETRHGGAAGSSTLVGRRTARRRRRVRRLRGDKGAIDTSRSAWRARWRPKACVSTRCGPASSTPRSTPPAATRAAQHDAPQVPMNGGQRPTRWRRRRLAAVGRRELLHRRDPRRAGGR